MDEDYPHSVSDHSRLFACLEAISVRLSQTMNLIPIAPWDWHVTIASTKVWSDIIEYGRVFAKRPENLLPLSLGTETWAEVDLTLQIEDSLHREIHGGNIQGGTGGALIHLIDPGIGSVRRSVVARMDKIGVFWTLVHSADGKLSLRLNFGEGSKNPFANIHKRIGIVEEYDPHITVATRDGFSSGSVGGTPAASSRIESTPELLARIMQSDRNDYYSWFLSGSKGDWIQRYSDLPMVDYL